MLSLDETGLNLSPLVCILLIKVVFLFSGVLTKKMKKSLVLREKKVMETCFKEEKRSHDVSRSRKASLKGQRECTIGHVLWHDRAENPAMKP